MYRFLFTQRFCILGTSTMVLHHRTSDTNKVEYLRNWLHHIVTEKCTILPPNFTPGLQLVHLPPEVKDGFLTLIVPMIKSRQDLVVKVRLPDCQETTHKQSSRCIHILGVALVCLLRARHGLQLRTIHSDCAPTFANGLVL
jgi:hypothetical protein